MKFNIGVTISTHKGQVQMCILSLYFITCMYLAMCVRVCIIAAMAARKNVLFTPYGVVKGVITRGGIVEAITDLL